MLLESIVLQNLSQQFKKTKEEKKIPKGKNTSNVIINLREKLIELIESKMSPNETKITVGTVGQPNVGKSSLLNFLMGKKSVSVSRTPGHTKRFQTLHLSEKIDLLDCPGLVFPALDRPNFLQILCGIFNIAQVREPYSAIRYLAERLPLEKMYGLKMEKDETEWTAYSLCEAYSRKRGYFVKKNWKSRYPSWRIRNVV